MSFWKIPALVFLILALQGAFLGLTDDEAYYWVLAQTPSLGYAYHPPAVAWLIALVQSMFGWMFPVHSPFLVRLPAALSAAATVALALFWMERAGVEGKRLARGGALLVSFAGFFSLAWMIVPDLPLFLGWTLALVASWEICFRKEDGLIRYLALFAGTALALLSKYSGVLAAASAFFVVLCWAPKERRLKTIVALFLGVSAAAVPAIIWNVNHEWASILYQIRDRHGGGALSFKRFARFWAAEALLAGPLLLAFGYQIVKHAILGERVYRFLLAWALPGTVFCIQPLWSDFKLHWVFIVWWPLALGFGWAFARAEAHAKFGRAQVIYGFVLGAVILVGCHVPVTGWVNRAISGREPDPRWDVTNDLYGWSALGSFLRERAGPEALRIPVVGSRYQTAAQAAFGLGREGRATLLPRDLKARDEWPSLGVSDSEGPEWPILTAPVWFVADNRYSEGPLFRGASCAKFAKYEERRWNLPAKSIEIWRCEPSRP